MVDDPELLELVEMEVRELLSQLRVPRRRHPGHRGLRAQGARGRPRVDAEDRRADGGRGHLHPGAGARDRQALPDADRGRLHDHRPRHRRDGSRRAGHRQGRRRDRDGRDPSGDVEDRRDRRRDVPEAPRPGPGGRQRRLPAPRHRSARRSSAARCSRSPARSRRTRTSRPRSTSSRRTRAAATRRSSTATGRSSTSARRTSPARSSCPRGRRWSCRATTPNMEVELIQPIAMDQGLRFAVREGGRTVGAGVVTEIIK